MNKMKSCISVFLYLSKTLQGLYRFPLTELLVNPGTLKLEENLLALECLTITGSMASPSFCTAWIKIFILILNN